MNYELRINNEEKVLPIVWINGKEQTINMDIELVKEGGNVHIVGIFIGSKNNAVTFNTTVVHKAAKTKSRTTIRGVFLNNSSISNDGLITIQKGAKGADGYFASKILLFNNAKGRSVPSLEIDENEVKAGHASTVGRPDDNQLFYLRSRGLSEIEAERLIISGFFRPVITFLSPSMQKTIERKIVTATKSEFT